MSTIENLCRFEAHATPLTTALGKGKETFDPLKFQLSSTDLPSPSFLHDHKTPAESDSEVTAATCSMEVDSMYGALLGSLVTHPSTTMDSVEITSQVMEVQAADRVPLGDILSLEKVVCAPSDSSFQDRPVNLGQADNLVPHDSLADFMDITLESDTQSMVTSPLTPIICVEDRADPSSIQAPASPNFASQANTSQLPLLQFLKKGQPGQSLHLSQATYNQLSTEKSFDFFNNSLQFLIVPYNFFITTVYCCSQFLTISYISYSFLQFTA